MEVQPCTPLLDRLSGLATVKAVWDTASSLGVPRRMIYYFSKSTTKSLVLDCCRGGNALCLESFLLCSWCQKMQWHVMYVVCCCVLFAAVGLMMRNWILARVSCSLICPSSRSPVSWQRSTPSSHGEGGGGLQNEGLVIMQYSKHLCQSVEGVKIGAT
jgi:hypothetical protein